MVSDKLKAFYFPHDIGASNDPKIIDLRMKFGWKAIGFYWAIIEALHKEHNGELKSELISSMIEDFYNQEEMRISQHIKHEAPDFEKCLYANALLEKIGSITTSKRVKKNLIERNEKSEKARHSAEIRWRRDVENKGVMKNTIVSCERIAIKERKVKESKINSVISHESFLEALKNTYNYINLDDEFKKMDGWLLANPHRKKTRRFIINWLNRVEKPLKTNEGVSNGIRIPKPL